MKITIYVPQEIELPDELLGQLERGARTNKRWVYDHDGSVPIESMLEEAAACGLVQLPADWHCAGDAPAIKNGRPRS